MRCRKTNFTRVVVQMIYDRFSKMSYIGCLRVRAMAAQG